MADNLVKQYAKLLIGEPVATSEIFNVGGTASFDTKIVVDPNGTYGNTTGVWFGDGSAKLYAYSDGNLAFETGDSISVYLTSTVIQGESNNQFLIYHTQTHSSNVPIYTFRGDTDTGMNRSDSATLHLITGAVTGLTINASQNIGIGTISPTLGKVQIEGTIGQILAMRNSTGANEVSTGEIRFITDATTRYAAIRGWRHGGSNKHGLKFITQTVTDVELEAMELDPDGNLAATGSISTTSGSLGTATLIGHELSFSRAAGNYIINSVLNSSRCSGHELGRGIY